jgi:hypothetical protein
MNGVKVPTILCHWDSYKLGLGSDHSDIYNWFNNFGKDMNNVRDDVAALLNEKEEEIVTQEDFNKMFEEYIKTLANKDATYESDALTWAQNEGLIQGDDKGRLMPKKFLTRGEMAVILQRYNEKH